MMRHLAGARSMVKMGAMDVRTGKTGDSQAPDMEALQVKRVRLSIEREVTS